ncbi:MAG TPA: hypothetical protein PKD26_11155 [Pyrinomonadaceae bacterium]|nr:hypothetical protein [Pyrinomonadaceae bacterium]
MSRFVSAFAAVVILGVFAVGQQPAAPWAVTMQQESSAASNISVVNQCRNRHTFQLQTVNAPFLQIERPQVEVTGKQTVDVPVRFSTVGLTAGVHQGQVTVVCRTCKNEPTCMQDHEVLQIQLNVTPRDPPQQTPAAEPPPPSPIPPKPSVQTEGTTSDRKASFNVILDSFLKGPCPEKAADCDVLRSRPTSLADSAALEKEKASRSDVRAEAAERSAEAAEKDAAAAEKLAEPASSDYAARVNGQEYSSADIAFLERLRQKNNSDLAAGRISVAEHQRRANELTAKKAREERLAREAELKKEAEAKRQEAATARAAAATARRGANEAASSAASAEAAAASAVAEYERCLKEIADRCRRESEAIAAKEKRKADELAAVERAKEQAANQRRNEEEARKRLAQNREYLLDNIKRLGLISSSQFKDVPGGFDAVIDKIIPDILGKTVEQWVAAVTGAAAEAVAGGPIPAGSVQAIGGIYQIGAALLDPCKRAGMQQTVARLQRMRNPRTGRNYNLVEALDKTDKMCNLLTELKDKVEAIKHASERK